MADIRPCKHGIYAKVVDASPKFNLQKIFLGDVSLGEPVGMATEGKNRRKIVKPDIIKAIESILAKGRCAEVRPTKDGPVVVEVIRHKVASEK